MNKSAQHQLEQQRQSLQARCDRCSKDKRFPISEMIAVTVMSGAVASLYFFI